MKLVQRRSWFGRVVAVVALLAMMQGASDARATAVQWIGLRNNTPVPANGVLTFSYEPEMTVRVVSADGNEVPGRFVRDGIWRPDEPFEVGTYMAQVSVEKLPERAEDRPFEVIEALSLPADFVQVRVTPGVEAAEVLEQVCCQEGAAFVYGESCSANCTPLCRGLVYAAALRVEVQYGVDRADPLGWQVEVRSPKQTETGQFPAGKWDVVADTDEICGVAEVFSWLDETTALTRHCVAHPKPDLRPIRETVDSFGDITECTVPPAGYEQPWCFHQAYTCEKGLFDEPETERESIVAACKQYYELCERRFAAPPPASGDVTEAEAPVTNESGAVTKGACGLSWGGPSQQTAWNVWLALGGLLLLRRLRGRAARRIQAQA